VEPDKLNQTALDMLSGILASYPGKAPISVVVVGRDLGDVVLQIAERRIKPNRDVITALDGVEGVANVRLVSKVGGRQKTLA
jgi:hypothetical protein